MYDTQSFAPLYSPNAGQGVGGLQPTVSVTATSANATTSTIFPGTQYNPGQKQIEICNQTTAWAYMNFGMLNTLVDATVASGYPIAPGADKVITVDEEVNAVSVILASGGTTGTVSFTRGAGV